MNQAQGLVLRGFEDADTELFSRWLTKEHVRRWYVNPKDWITEIEERHTKFCWIHHHIAEFERVPVGFGQGTDQGTH